MTPPDDAGEDRLRDRIDVLEAENARLRSRLDAPGGPAASPAPASPRSRFSWRALASALCIVVAALLVPVAVVAGWARVQIVDEAAFVATFAPLASDPEIQTAVIDIAVATIEESVDIDGTTDAVFDGIDELGLPRSASAALGLLRGPAAAGLHSLLRTGVTGFVESDLFADTWNAALRTSHRTFLAAVAAQDSAGPVVIDPDGALILHLGPVIADIRDHLVEDGFALAALVPAVEVSFTLAQSEALVLVGVVYRVSEVLGTWLPVLTVALFLAGIALARRRRTAIIGTGLGLVLGAGGLLLAFAVALSAVPPLAAQSGLPLPAVAAAIGHLVGGLQRIATNALIVGLVVLTLAILLGLPVLRRRMAALNARIGRALGRPRSPARQQRLRSLRPATRGALIVLPTVLVLVLPLSTGGTMLIIAAALLLWWTLAVMEGPDATGAAVEGPPSPADPGTAEPADDHPGDEEDAATSMPGVRA